MKVYYRYVFGVCCALLSMTVSANTFDSIKALESALYNCEASAVRQQPTCVTEVLTSDEIEQSGLIQEITSWQKMQAIESIFSISTHVVVEGMLIDKSVRLATTDSMAIINLRLNVDHESYKVSDVSFISGENSVINNVCGNSCHS